MSSNLNKRFILSPLIVSSVNKKVVRQNICHSFTINKNVPSSYFWLCKIIKKCLKLSISETKFFTGIKI